MTFCAAHLSCKPCHWNISPEPNMASTFFLAPSSPMPDHATAHSHHVLEGSYSSAQSECTTGTVQHHPPRSLSGSSLSSLTSLWTPAFRHRHDESTPSRSSSSHNLTLRRITNSSDRRSISGSYTRRHSLVSVISSRLRSEPILSSEYIEQRLAEVAEPAEDIAEEGEDAYSLAEEDHSMHTAYELECTEAPLQGEVVSPLKQAATSPPLPRMRRWISTLRRRKQELPQVATPRVQRWKLDDFDGTGTSPIKRVVSHHKHSHSNSSSLGFVTAVKSATATLASVSIATVSGRHTRWRRGNQRSSLVSGSDPRPSIESQRSIFDEAARQRSRKRRAKLEELIRTEENYVADLKSLSNVTSSVRIIKC